MTRSLKRKDAEDFGRRLRAWRQARQLDLDSASRLLVISGNYLYMMERGVHPPSDSLLARFEEASREPFDGAAPEIMRRIPIISWVQAGRFTGYEELPPNWVEYIDCLCPDPNAFAVRVVGESMLPEYPPGNLAICMPGFPPRNNALVVAKISDGSVTFKTVTFRGKLPGRFRFVPTNPKYPPVIVRREDVAWIYPVHAVLSPC